MRSSFCIYANLGYATCMIYGPEHEALKARVRALLPDQRAEAIHAGIYTSYERLVRLMLSHTAHFDDAERAQKTEQLTTAARAEQPLIARLARVQQPSVFLITLGRADYDTLEDLPGSRLNLATLHTESGQPKFANEADYFSMRQIDIVARQANDILQVDGRIGYRPDVQC